MKIQFEGKDKVSEIIEYIYQHNNNTEEYCHLCPREHGELVSAIERLAGQESSSLLVIRDEDNEIRGVFRLLVEEDDRYLEMLWGFVQEPSVYEVLFDHLREAYSGYHLDAVVTKVNQTMYHAYEKQGIVYNDEEMEMHLGEYTPKPVSANIVKYKPIYEQSFRAIHDDEGVYWTAERMLQALERYNVMLAVENGEAVGYIEMTTGCEENEPIQLLVAPEHRGKGYGRALLQAAIEAELPKKVMLEVYVNNTPAVNLYRSLGFKETLREYLGSMTV